MKGSISGLSFDNIQESAWRDSEPPRKIGIATAIRKRRPTEYKNLGSVTPRTNLPGETELKNMQPDQSIHGSRT